MAKKNYLECELDQLIENDPSIRQFIRSASLEGVWYWDLENPEHEWTSEEFWKVLGFEPDAKKHFASEWQALIFEEDLEATQANLEKHLADPDYSFDQVVRYRREDGGTTWVRSRGIAIRDASGTPTRLLGAHTDLSEVMNMRNDLEGANGVLTSVLDATPNGILGLDAEGRVLVANLTARHMLGGISDPVPFAWPPSIRFLDAEKLEPLDQSADPVRRLLSGMTLKGETSLMSRQKADSDPRYVKLTSSEVISDGSPVTYVLVVEDVSELENNRQQVERTSRLDALGQLTGGVAHDFNNILQIIQYGLDLIGDNQLDQEAQGHLATMRKSVDRGARLTQRLLAFAKRQPGLAASAYARDVLIEFDKLAAPVIEEAIEFTTSTTGSDVWAYCDVGQLENALLNLVLNARDAIMRDGKGSQINVSVRSIAELDGDVTLRREDTESYIMRGLSAVSETEDMQGTVKAYRYVEFAVTDNGPGMSEEVRRRAVDPFFTTKETSSGTGLGLSMVYGFVQQAGGELRIYSVEGIGTTVRIVVPRGTEMGEREGPVRRVQQTGGAQQKVLIVEDEEGLLGATCDVVRAMGYVVTPAKNGVDALRMVRSGTELDLLLTDVVMPRGLSGFELAREVREIHPELPVVYMSGYAGFTDDQIGAVKAPLVQKPSPPAELADILRRALSKGNRNAAS